MLRYCLFALSVIGVSLAVRCWNGQETTPGGGTPYQNVNCPTSDFCFNSYVKRHHNGDDSYTITKSCGEPGKCFETGCEGPGDEKRCCCVGDLCNAGSNPLFLGTAGIAAVYQLLRL